MKENEKKARENFRNGYNCAQSVFLVYADKYGFDKETALKLSSSFGGGMGRLREVCGAVTSMFMIAGLEDGYIENNNDDVKGKHYARIQNLAREFKQKYNTVICRELLGLDENEEISPIPSKRTGEYYEQRPCEDFIAYACKILDDYLAKEKDR